MDYLTYLGLLIFGILGFMLKPLVTMSLYYFDYIKDSKLNLVKEYSFNGTLSKDLWLSWWRTLRNMGI